MHFKLTEVLAVGHSAGPKPSSGHAVEVDCGRGTGETPSKRKRIYEEAQESTCKSKATPVTSKENQPVNVSIIDPPVSISHEI